MTCPTCETSGSRLHARSRQHAAAEAGVLAAGCTQAPVSLLSRMAFWLTVGNARFEWCGWCRSVTPPGHTVAWQDHASAGGIVAEASGAAGRHWGALHVWNSWWASDRVANTTAALCWSRYPNVPTQTRKMDGASSSTVARGESRESRFRCHVVPARGPVPHIPVTPGRSRAPAMSMSLDKLSRTDRTRADERIEHIFYVQWTML